MCFLLQVPDTGSAARRTYPVWFKSERIRTGTGACPANLAAFVPQCPVRHPSRNLFCVQRKRWACLGAFAAMIAEMSAENRICFQFQFC